MAAQCVLKGGKHKDLWLVLVGDTVNVAILETYPQCANH